MSVVHDLLTKVEETEQTTYAPWGPVEKKQKSGLFVFDLPNEIINDFYDLKEYIRIANLRGEMRVLSIANSITGEGSSTIATYLAFLMAGGMMNRVAKTVSGDDSNKAIEEAEKKLHEIPETDKIFTSNFQSLHSTDATTKTVFKNWENDLQDRRYPSDDNSENILLVDGNMHQPSLHRFFGLDPENGLAEIIEQDKDWAPLAKPVHDSNLKIITAGSTSMNPVELLSSERFNELVQEWKSDFRYVIFDSPAVLNYVDSLSLASSVDGVVLVVRAGQTRWESAQHAKRKLSTAHANLLGVALNRRKMDIPDGLYKRLM